MNDDRNRSSFALQPIKLIHARQVVFGIGAAEQCAQDLVSRGVRRVFVVTSSPVASLAEPISRRSPVESVSNGVRGPSSRVELLALEVHVEFHGHVRVERRDEDAWIGDIEVGPLEGV